MQWLLHGSLSGAVAEALGRRGHKTHASAELGLAADAAALEILRAADARQWDVITSDSAMSGAPFENGLPFSRSIVYLQLEGGEVEQDDAIDRLFTRYKRLTPRRLYTVTGSRVKIRQLPGKVGG